MHIRKIISDVLFLTDMNQPIEIGFSLKGNI